MEPMWITGEIKQLIRKRKRLYRIAKIQNRQADWYTFRQLRNKIISLIKTAKADHISSLAQSLTDKSTNKSWWSTVKNFLTSNNQHKNIPPLLQNNNILYTDEEKADAFNHYF